MRTQMNGYIVGDEDAWIYRWFGYTVCCPADIRKAVADNPPGETLTVEINNYGGSMFAGFEIYSVLRAASCPTQAEIQSLAASAASTAMLGCDRVTATPVAQVMIHNPSILSDGNQHGHRRTADELEGFAQSILNAYELKCQGRRTREELADMMDQETWLTVQEAMDAGLVDEVVGGVLPGQVVNVVGGGLRALSCAGGLPSAEELRARKAAQESAGPREGPADKTDPEARRLSAALWLKKYI